MATAKKKGVSEPKREPAPVSWPFGKINYIVFGIAILVIAIGYLTLAKGSITLSPILLVVGYCVLIPIAIILRPRSETSETPDVNDTAAPDQQS